MKKVGILFVAMFGLGGCAMMGSPPPASQARETPCKEFQSKDQRQATENFGTCLAMADGLAAAHKPTATPPDATHWNMPVMQGFVAGTTHGSAGSPGV